MSRVIDDKVRALLDRATREIDEGILPSCQLAIAHGGEIVAFETLGQATDDTRYVIMSCTKGLVSGALWLLLGEGSLSLDDTVAEIVPEFGANGKQAVTVEHLTRHTAGFPHAFMNPYHWDDHDKRMQAFADWSLASEPGSRYAYHALSAFYVVAEIIERIAGCDYRTFISERILDPLRLERLKLGVPQDEQSDIAELQVVGGPPTRAELEAAWGISEMPGTQVPHAILLPLAEPRALEVGIPSANAVSTAADLALYYQAVLANRLWEPETLSRCIGDVKEFPDDIGRPTTRAIGVQVNGAHGYSGWYCFGKTNSPDAFGHDGAGGMIAWADPATGLSFCYLTNGLDENLVRQKKRGVGLSSRAAVCAMND